MAMALADLRTLAVLFIFTCAFSSFVTGLKRLSYHPLRKYPGPKLAAITIWWMGYHELRGTLTEKLTELHVIYGPVIRIAPNELHFSDPAAYADIYHNTSKTTKATITKDPFHYDCFTEMESSFGFTDPRAARERRDILNPLFSRRAILKLEHVVQERVNTLISRVLSYEVLNKPVNISLAFRSTTFDIITSYCFANCHHALEYEDFHHPILMAVEALLPMSAKFKYFPIARDIILNLPQWAVLRLNPVAQSFHNMQTHMAEQVDQILADPTVLERADQEIVYHHLMKPQPGKLFHSQIPTKKSLLEEGTNLLIAGSDTVGNATAVGTFHVLSNKTVCSKLVQELTNTWPDKDAPMNYETLEKLPYLTAVIKESLRVSHGVVSGLPRRIGSSEADIAGYQVPPGTTVSIISTFLHNNPAIFTDPHMFDPERWLGPNVRDLETYLVPFSRGPRMCLGINLAWCELYLIFGNVFRKIDMQVEGTTARDLEWNSHFLPVYKGKHIFARVKERDV